MAVKERHSRPNSQCFYKVNGHLPKVLNQCYYQLHIPLFILRLIPLSVWCTLPDSCLNVPTTTRITLKTIVTLHQLQSSIVLFSLRFWQALLPLSKFQHVFYLWPTLPDPSRALSVFPTLLRLFQGSEVGARVVLVARTRWLHRACWLKRAAKPKSLNSTNLHSPVLFGPMWSHTHTHTHGCTYYSHSQTAYTHTQESDY